MAFGKITIRREDTLFSRYIRTRDNWTCVSCKTKYPENSQGLQCSHYWSRKNEATRFDPENCDALCAYCHQKWGGDYRANYTAFKKRQLGEKQYKALMIRAHCYYKKDRKLALMYVKSLLKNISLL